MLFTGRYMATAFTYDLRGTLAPTPTIRNAGTTFTGVTRISAEWNSL